MSTPRDEPTFWNGWRIMSAIGAAITFLAGLLEVLGVWHDLGLGVGFMGLAITLFFGANSATGAGTQQIDRRLDQMHDTLLHILKVLDQRLPDARSK